MAVPFLPEGFTPLGEAFEQARSRLTNCDELERRIGELDALIFSRTGGGITDGELFYANDQRQALIDVHDAVRRRFQDRFRVAALAGEFSVWSLNPISRQYEPILLDPEEWNLMGLGDDIDTFADDIFSPGPDTEGRPLLVRDSEFEPWLNAAGPPQSQQTELAPPPAPKRKAGPRKTDGDAQLAQELVRQYKGSLKLARRAFVSRFPGLSLKRARARFLAGLKKPESPAEKA